MLIQGPCQTGRGERCASKPGPGALLPARNCRGGNALPGERQTGDGVALDVLDQVVRLFEPLAFIGVFGGSLVAAALRSTRDDLARALGALKPLLTARPDADAAAAMRAVRAIEAIAQVRHIACADRVETAGRFLRRAAFRLADARVPAEFSLWANEESELQARRHEGAIGVWRAMADAGPAMGMIGTVIGLIAMFAEMDDAAAIGPAMALAMLTTLYGIVVATVVAGPIAARLERLSLAERAWQAQALRRLEALVTAELTEPQSIARPQLRTVS